MKGDLAELARIDGRLAPDLKDDFVGIHNIPNLHPLFGKEITVRINGIDTAEIKSRNPCEKEVANKAKKLLYSVLQNAQQINLNNVKRDKYFIILADVSADQNSIKDFLLKNKLANEYFGETKPEIDWCNFGK